jgi:uncharacterized membrane protein
MLVIKVKETAGIVCSVAAVVSAAAMGPTWITSPGLLPGRRCDQCYLVICVTCGVSNDQSYVTTGGQSASLSWCQAPIWSLRTDFYYCQTVAKSRDSSVGIATGYGLEDRGVGV